MNFDLSEEQQMLADTTREVLSGYDTEKRNKVIDSDEGFSREVWQQLAEIGILGLGFDEDSGPIEVMVVLTVSMPSFSSSMVLSDRLSTI